VSFRKWRLKRIGRVAPGNLAPAVYGEIVRYCQFYPYLGDPSSLADLLESRYGLTREAAFKMIYEVLGERPDLVPSVRRHATVLVRRQPPPVIR
jgi:hypothetical protein